MKAIVFDMDGVLFDTERICRDSWVAVAEKWGFSDMDVIFPKCIGLNANDSKAVVLDAYGEDFAYQEFRSQASTVFWELIEKNGMPLMPGVRELLQWLKEDGWVIGLASSTKRSSIEDCLKRAKLQGYFQEIVSGDMVEHSKPQPDIYLMACERLGVSPRETYAIEDSPNGIRAAHRAGMHSLMVPDMITPDEEMQILSEKIFDNLFDVLKYFQRQEQADWEEPENG